MLRQACRDALAGDEAVFAWLASPDGTAPLYLALLGVGPQRRRDLATLVSTEEGRCTLLARMEKLYRPTTV